MLPRFGSALIGTGTDPQLFAWAFAWWPHALGAGENPIVSHALWTPLGSDLAWATAVPGLALPLAPRHAPRRPDRRLQRLRRSSPRRRSAASAAFLLCRRLGARRLARARGRLSVRLLELPARPRARPPAPHRGLPRCRSSALACLRFLEGELGARGLVVAPRPAARAPVRPRDGDPLHAHACARGRRWPFWRACAPRRRPALRRPAGAAPRLLRARRAARLAAARLRAARLPDGRGHADGPRRRRPASASPSRPR